MPMYNCTCVCDLYITLHACICTQRQSLSFMYVHKCTHVPPLVTYERIKPQQGSMAALLSTCPRSLICAHTHKQCGYHSVLNLCNLFHRLADVSWDQSLTKQEQHLVWILLPCSLLWHILDEKKISKMYIEIGFYYLFLLWCVMFAFYIMTK